MSGTKKDATDEDLQAKERAGKHDHDHRGRSEEAKWKRAVLGLHGRDGTARSSTYTRKGQTPPGRG